MIFPIVLSGIAYALCAGTAWNGTFYLIERHKIGFATGLQSSMMSILLLGTPLVFGWLADHSNNRDHGYQAPMMFQLLLSLLSIFINLLNYFYDKVYNEGVLAMDVEERNKLFQAKHHRNQ